MIDPTIVTMTPLVWDVVQGASPLGPHSLVSWPLASSSSWCSADSGGETDMDECMKEREQGDVVESGGGGGLLSTGWSWKA